MRSLAEIGVLLEATGVSASAAARAHELLAAGEDVLEQWIIAHDQEPTHGKVEGFRLLALQRQAAKGDPSFNACRETCRELVYHRNLILAEPDAEAAISRATMMRFVLNHLFLFIGGKMEVAGLGEFCCSSRALRTESA
jgi:hypothetical protein